MQSIMHEPVLLCINRHTTFELPSFTNSKDMIAGQNFKKTGHVSLTTPLLRVICDPYAGT